MTNIKTGGVVDVAKLEHSAQHVRIKSVADLPEWSTREQVSEVTQMAVQTLARWATEGRGPRVTKFGRTVRYYRGDVEEFLTAQREASPSPENAA